MKMWKRPRSLTLLLVIALLMLLPLLAVLQYHWLGEVNQGEREKMKSSLQIRASQFGQDFDRELVNAYLHFGEGLQGAGVQPEAAFSDSYRRWHETAAHPRLIGELYQAKLNDRGKYDLMRFVPASNRFEPREWPENLKEIPAMIERQRQAREAARLLFRETHTRRDLPGIENGPNKTFFQILIGPVAEDLPGLIIPLIPREFLVREPDPGPPSPQAYGLIVFDLDYLRRELIPELVDRHFSNEGRRDYYVAISRRQDPQQVIYRSDTEMPADVIDHSDVSENFFRIEGSELNRVVFTRLRDDRRLDAEQPARSRHLSIGLHENWLQFRDRENGGQDGSQPVLKFPPKFTQEGYWQLAAKHRAGSLDAAVAVGRRWNLAVSFGILILLGISIGLIVLSSRRAQKLALHQMEFVTGVSHELRTPLAVICSAGENLADGVIDNREQIRRYGSLIRDEGRRLAAMVEQVLEFAGARSEHKRYELRPADLKTVVENALAVCKLQILEGGFEIEEKMAAGPVVVEAETAALSRAIQNLLSNAMKYSGQSRWLGLSLELVKTPSGEEAQIKVSDRGLGISSSELSHIFEPFYRGREVTAAQIHGNGLGLSLVKHIIEGHGGRVSVTSKSGQGTSFTLHLPVRLPAESSIDPLGKVEKDHEQAHLAH